MLNFQKNLKIYFNFRYEVVKIDFYKAKDFCRNVFKKNLIYDFLPECPKTIFYKNILRDSIIFCQGDLDKYLQH